MEKAQNVKDVKTVTLSILENIDKFKIKIEVFVETETRDIIGQILLHFTFFYRKAICYLKELPPLWTLLEKYSKK